MLLTTQRETLKTDWIDGEEKPLSHIRFSIFCLIVFLKNSLFIYLFIYFDIQQHSHSTYNSGYSVDVKDDSDRKASIARRRLRKGVVSR